jgi:FimV-like protein
MHQRTFLASRSSALICAAVLFALLPTVSQALGVGELKLQSALSEPFRAEIELTSISPKDLKTLKARFISQANLGTETLPQGAPITRQLLVRITDGPDGRHLLQIYSDQSIREPYVRFLLQLDWVGGRLTREFTALLDPRQGALESEASGLEAQIPPSAEDTQTPATTVEAPSAVETAAAGGASATPQVRAQVSEAEQVNRSLDPKPKDMETTETQPEASKSEQVKSVSVSNQQERLASEIKTWAQRHTHPHAGTEAREAGASETETRAGPSARNSGAEMRRKIAELERANVQAPQQRQTTLFGWVLEHTNELLMAAVALVALLLVGFGTAWLMLTWRPQPTPSINPQAASLASTEVVEKRQRGGRRRQFVPVAIERRRGPRRQSDLLQPALAPIHTSEASSDFDPDDAVERALKEEIGKYPDRLGLKLKLLALYHSCNDKAAFETLLNNIYASAESGPASYEEHWPRFEDYDELGASDGSAPVLTTLSSPQPDDDGEAKAGKDTSANDDAPEPTLLGPADIPEYPLLMDEQDGIDIDEGLLDLQSSLIEYEPAGVEDLTVGPLAADAGDFEHEVLHADDLSNVRKIVEQGMDLIQRNNDDQQGAPPTKARASKKSGKRKRESGPSAKSKELAEDAQGKGHQWRDPAKKIDLAKAYIDMGDAERARHILDEVLQHWQGGDGTDS